MTPRYMGRGKAWEDFEDEVLAENYAAMTTKELFALLPHRSKKGIERRIEALRKMGKIAYRDEETVDRAYRNRKRELKGDW